MTLEGLQKICHDLGEVAEDIKWEDHLCFTVGGKIFLITSPDLHPITASFKTDEENFNELKEMEGFKPAPYLAKHKWIFVDDINRLSTKEWKQYLALSFEMVKAKLPKKKR